VTEFDAKKLKELTETSRASASAFVQSRTAELDRDLVRHLRERPSAEEPLALVPSEDDPLRHLRGVPFN
jgi:hypothetical protein